MARRVSNSVAPWRRSSAGWIPAIIEKQSACVGRRHSVTIRKASLMISRGRIQGGIGVIALPETCNSNFTHRDLVHFGK